MNETTAVDDAIVVGVDGSQDSDRAVTWAAEQAVLEGRRLVVLAAGGRGHAKLTRSEALSFPESPLLAETDPRSIAARNAVALAAQRHPAPEVASLTAEADPRHALVDASRTARLLVLGSHGRGVVRTTLLGSVSASVTRHASCPVVVTRPHRPGTWKRGVVVGADGTPESHGVIDFAFQLASFRELPLTVMHTYLNGEPAAPGSDDPGLGAASDPEVALSLSLAGFAERYPDVYLTEQLSPGATQRRLRQGLHPWNVIVIGRHQVHPVTGSLTRTVSTAVLERYDGVVAMVPEPEPG